MKIYKSSRPINLAFGSSITIYQKHQVTTGFHKSTMLMMQRYIIQATTIYQYCNRHWNHLSMFSTCQFVYWEKASNVECHEQKQKQQQSANFLGNMFSSITNSCITVEIVAKYFAHQNQVCMHLQVNCSESTQVSRILQDDINKTRK